MEQHSLEVMETAQAEWQDYLPPVLINGCFLSFRLRKAPQRDRDKLIAVPESVKQQYFRQGRFFSTIGCNEMGRWALLSAGKLGPRLAAVRASFLPTI